MIVEEFLDFDMSTESEGKDCEFIDISGMMRFRLVLGVIPLPSLCFGEFTLLVGADLCSPTKWRIPASSSSTRIGVTPSGFSFRSGEN